MATSFPEFGRLPPEIRRIIWTFTLRDGPTLCLFGWRWYVQFIDLYNEVEESEGVDRRPYVEVPMPAALFVCREAREAAHAWMAARNVTMRFRDETQGHILVREWDPEQDPVYVPRNKWEDFSNLEEEWDKEWENGSAELGAAIRHLAVPAFTGYFSIPTLSSLLDWMPNLRSLYIVWGELPDMRKSKGAQPEGMLFDVEVQPRWEMENEDSEVTSMCVVDPDDGEVSWEEVDMKDFCDEIEQQWALSEVSETFLTDLGEVKLEMVHVRVKEVGVGGKKAVVGDS
ncbi:hypothetical protein BGZ61DRAFT_532784 [Ilyonectria robusta]|uniref:uncharacterized protein n=1 Tax=Ilyonectria robusta TaxID=1079257 RepID=UPI001E8DF5CC|nr:uncharacterized protein BGZ61DRAFT_532784 [Ilyonectria robusta]KAH8694745.1 hypothetical protein BGZ61DRAFT_532784 [Ilyonectria robusta]